mgnify:CR=1 FL=1
MVHISRPRVYHYDGWIFEVSPVNVWPLTKTGEPRKKAGEKFWKVYALFDSLPKETKEKYRLGGGNIWL